MAKIGTAYVDVAGNFAPLNKAIAANQGSIKSRLGTIAKAGALAGAAIGVAAVKANIDFRHSMEQISTQAGATQKEVKNLSEQVLQLSTKSVFGPEDLAQALFHVESVGFRGAEAMKVLNASQKLATVGNSDLESTTYALVSAQETGIKGTEKLSKTIGTLNAIVGTGDLRMEDLTSALSTGILPTARAFGLSLKEVGGALDVFTSRGVPAQAAATRLRMTISLLGAQTPQAEEQLKGIGIQAGVLGETLQKKGLLAAVKLLADHLKNAGDKAQQAQVITRAFGGGRTSSGILTLVQNTKDLGERLQGITDKAGNFNEKLREAKMDPENQLRNAMAQINVLLVNLGAKIAPAAVKALTGITDIITDPKLANDEKISKVTDLITKTFTDAAPHIAAAMVKVGGEAAKGLITGFIKADPLGKLFIAGALIRIIGGPTALRAVGAKMAAPIVSGFAATETAGMVASTEAAMAASAAAARASAAKLGPVGAGAMAPVLPTKAVGTGAGAMTPVPTGPMQVAAKEAGVSSAAAFGTSFKTGLGTLATSAKGYVAGVGGRLGGALAGGIAAQIVGSTVGGPIGSAISNIGSMAAAGFALGGPWGAAAGAAAGAIITGFQPAKDFIDNLFGGADDTGQRVFATRLRETAQAAKRAAKDERSAIAGLSDSSKRLHQAKEREKEITKKVGEAQRAANRALKQYGPHSRVYMEAEAKVVRLKHQEARASKEEAHAERLHGVSLKAARITLRASYAAELTRVRVLRDAKRAITQKLTGDEQYYKKTGKGSKAVTRDYQMWQKRTQQLNKAELDKSKTLRDAANQVGPKFLRQLKGMSAKTVEFGGNTKRAAATAKAFKGGILDLPDPIHKAANAIQGAGENFKKGTDKAGQSVSNLANTVRKGEGNIKTNTNKSLGAFGAKGLKFSLEPLGGSGKQVGGTFDVPGTGFGDKIPTRLMLEPGERGFILNRTATRAMDALKAVNKRFPRFGGKKQTGGEVQHLAKGGMTAMIAEASRFESRHFPYRWGGGHGSFGIQPVDCSGAVSDVLHAAGLLSAPMVSGALAHWGKAGAGPLTVYANPVHTFMSLDGKFFGTSSSNPGGGAGWMPDPGAGYRGGFASRTMPVGAAVGMLKRLIMRGRKGPLLDIGQGALDKTRGAANKYIQKKMPKGSFGGGQGLADFPPGAGKVVGASVYGFGEAGTGTVGASGQDLRGKPAFAELDMGTALGHLPFGSRLKISVGSRTAVGEKLDIGAGGGDVAGHHRAIDFWRDLATKLGLSGTFLGLAKVKGMMQGGYTKPDRLSLPSFDLGGLVPGPAGKPVLGLLHGGEAVVPGLQDGGDFDLHRTPPHHHRGHVSRLRLRDDRLKEILDRLEKRANRVQREGEHDVRKVEAELKKVRAKPGDHKDEIKKLVEERNRIRRETRRHENRIDQREKAVQAQMEATKELISQIKQFHRDIKEHNKLTKEMRVNEKVGMIAVSDFVGRQVGFKQRQMARNPGTIGSTWRT